MKVNQASIDKQAEQQRRLDRQDFPLVSAIDRADLSEEDAQISKVSQQVGEDISAEE
jgi:hypothetical protein